MYFQDMVNRLYDVYLLGVVFFTFIFVQFTSLVLPPLWWDGNGEIAVAIGLVIAGIAGARKYGVARGFLGTMIYSVGVYQTSAYVKSGSGIHRLADVSPRLLLILIIPSIFVSIPGFLLGRGVRAVVVRYTGRSHLVAEQD